MTQQHNKQRHNDIDDTTNKPFKNINRTFFLLDVVVGVGVCVIMFVVGLGCVVGGCVVLCVVLCVVSFFVLGGFV